MCYQDNLLIKLLSSFEIDVEFILLQNRYTYSSRQTLAHFEDILPLPYLISPPLPVKLLVTAAKKDFRFTA
jgi:hypothetical protein